MKKCFTVFCFAFKKQNKHTLIYVTYVKHFPFQNVSLFLFVLLMITPISLLITTRREF